jgi:hypothetical protein
MGESQRCGALERGHNANSAVTEEGGDAAIMVQTHNSLGQDAVRGSFLTVTCRWQPPTVSAKARAAPRAPRPAPGLAVADGQKLVALLPDGKADAREVADFFLARRVRNAHERGLPMAERWSW